MFIQPRGSNFFFYTSQFKFVITISNSCNMYILFIRLLLLSYHMSMDYKWFKLVFYFAGNVCTWTIQCNRTGESIQLETNGLNFVWVQPFDDVNTNKAICGASALFNLLDDNRLNKCVRIFTRNSFSFSMLINHQCQINIGKGLPNESIFWNQIVRHQISYIDW